MPDTLGWLPKNLTSWCQKHRCLTPWSLIPMCLIPRYWLLGHLPPWCQLPRCSTPWCSLPRHLKPCCQLPSTWHPDDDYRSAWHTTAVHENSIMQEWQRAQAKTLKGKNSQKHPSSMASNRVIKSLKQKENRSSSLRLYEHVKRFHDNAIHKRVVSRLLQPVTALANFCRHSVAVRACSRGCKALLVWMTIFLGNCQGAYALAISLVLVGLIRRRDDAIWHPSPSCGIIMWHCFQVFLYMWPAFAEELKTRLLSLTCKPSWPEHHPYQLCHFSQSEDGLHSTPLLVAVVKMVESD